MRQYGPTVPDPRTCPRCRRVVPEAMATRCALDGAWLVTPWALDRGDGDPLLGATIGERFGLLGLRAVGGRAAVYEAIDASGGGLCLVKCARFGPDSCELQDAFERESRILRRVGGPAVPTVLGAGAGVVPSRPGRLEEPVRVAWIAMEDVGPSLADTTIVPSLKMVLCLAEALDSLHTAGVAHGDLKPAHVTIRRHGANLRLALVDLGSAICPDEPGPRDGGSTAYLPSDFGPSAPRSLAQAIDLDGYAAARILETLGLQPVGSCQASARTLLGLGRLSASDRAEAARAAFLGLDG
jgi:hypothetical protein